MKKSDQIKKDRRKEELKESVEFLNDAYLNAIKKIEKYHSK